jgi:hypothetical protein
MRFLIKIEIPTESENPAAGKPDFENDLTRLYLALGAQSAYSDTDATGRRSDAIVVEIDDVRELKPKAKLIFDFLKVRPTFLPETANKDHFGF